MLLIKNCIYIYIWHQILVLIYQYQNQTHYVKKSHLKLSYNNLVQPYYTGFTSIVIGFDIKNKEDNFSLEY